MLFFKLFVQLLITKFFRVNYMKSRRRNKVVYRRGTIYHSKCIAAIPVLKRRNIRKSWRFLAALMMRIWFHIKMRLNYLNVWIALISNWMEIKYKAFVLTFKQRFNYWFNFKLDISKTSFSTHQNCTNE